MKFSDFFSKMVGHQQPPNYKTEPAAAHNGCEIYPAPQSEGGRFYVAGVIKKTFPEGVQEYAFVRADTFSSHEEACAFAIIKARRIIDEQGDQIFSRRVSP